jgi:hypothetical protein
MSGPNSPAMTIANGNISFAQDVYDTSLRRSVSDTQLVRDASTSMALPSTLAEAFTCEASPHSGEHRRSVSDGHYSHTQSGSLLAPADERAPSPSPPSTPSTIRRMERDFSDNHSATDLAMNNTEPISDRLYALECPVCDEDLAGWSEEKRRNHMNTCFDGPEYAEGAISLPDRLVILRPNRPNNSLYPWTCPVCDQHLDGRSEESRTAHVNTCLDSPSDAENSRSYPSSSKLPFYRPSGGNWACRTCRSEVVQPLSIGICGLCGSHRSRHDPSSHNDFEILEPFRIPLTGPSSLDNFRTMDGSIARRKIVLMGDANCGKTWLAQ